MTLVKIMYKIHYIIITKGGKKMKENKRRNNVNSVNNNNNSDANIGRSNNKCSIKWRTI